MGSLMKRAEAELQVQWIWYWNECVTFELSKEVTVAEPKETKEKNVGSEVRQIEKQGSDHKKL
jgi:hypothetical protein